MEEDILPGSACTHVTIVGPQVFAGCYLVTSVPCHGGLSIKLVTTRKQKQGKREGKQQGGRGKVESNLRSDILSLLPYLIHYK